MPYIISACYLALAGGAFAVGPTPSLLLSLTAGYVFSMWMFIQAEKDPRQ